MQNYSSKPKMKLTGLSQNYENSTFVILSEAKNLIFKPF